MAGPEKEILTSTTEDYDNQREHDQILKEYHSKGNIFKSRYDFTATSFVIPATGGFTQRSITLKETSCKYKKLIFLVIYSAYYEYFFTDEYPQNVKDSFPATSRFVVDYLNSYSFEVGNEIKFFRSYEAYRINQHNVLPSSTGLATLLSWIRLVSTIHTYTANLEQWQTNYLARAALIRALSNAGYKRNQTTLTSWFTFSTWLRRDDQGVGHHLYSKLASPKALTTSFTATVTAALNEIQMAKEALINLFVEQKVKPFDFPTVIENEESVNRSRLWVVRNHKINQLRILRSLYHQHRSRDKHLHLAMTLVIKEMVIPKYYDEVRNKFFSRGSGEEFETSNCLVTQKFSTHKNESLFGSRFLSELVEFIDHRPEQNADKPKSVAEQAIFSWLMAYQTVQPSDIYKLTLGDFRLVRRVNGRVTHIDLEYFKGRAKTIYQVRTLEVKTLLGSVILRYIQDLSDLSSCDKRKKLITNDKLFQAGSNKLFDLCDNEIADRVNANLVKEKASPVFIKSMIALIKNGVRFTRKLSYTVSYDQYRNDNEFKCQKGLFSLTAIKNSSVHSRSDTFTPTQLLNFHSHTDTIERDWYLTEDNEEWLNNAGLITRAVMNDLMANLYRASSAEIADFNSEFSRTLSVIANKKTHMLSQMKLVTREAKGESNHLGLVEEGAKLEGDFPDTIYLLNTPETVFKLLNYQRQVRENSHLLIQASPEFLLFTVLPTVEWIEELFDKKAFSEVTMKKGRKMFSRYADEVPPLFQNHIR